MANTPYPRSPHGSFARYFIAMPEFGVPYISGVEYSSPHPSMMHTHPETQMLSILRGKMFVQIPPQTFELKPGGVCVIPAECRHRVWQDTRSPYVLFVDIRMNDDGVFAKFLEAFGGQQEFRTDAATLRTCAAELRKLQHEFGPLRTSRLMGVLWRIFGNMSHARPAVDERQVDVD
jgi:mannose-6-phosphate isomerase-like protein (cupin superfamily)